jgi:hypothetical protein
MMGLLKYFIHNLQNISASEVTWIGTGSLLSLDVLIIGGFNDSISCGMKWAVEDVRLGIKGVISKPGCEENAIISKHRKIQRIKLYTQTKT